MKKKLSLIFSIVAWTIVVNIAYRKVRNTDRRSNKPHMVCIRAKPLVFFVPQQVIIRLFKKSGVRILLA